MRIIVAHKEAESEKEKGDLVEKLATQLVKAQDYSITEDNRNIRKTGVELDLLCKHKTIRGHTIYVECKAYSEKHTIQSDIIKQLAGTQSLKKFSQSWLISTAPLGKDAKGLVEEIHNSDDSGKFAFYTPENLIDALASSGVIISEEIAKNSALNIVQTQKNISDNATFLVSKYGYYWLFEYLKGGEPAGLIYIDAKDGDVIIEKELLDNLSSLKSDIGDLNHNIILDILSLTRDDVAINDIKSLGLSGLYLNEIDDLGIKINNPKKQALNLSDTYIYPDLEELDETNKKTIESAKIASGEIKKGIIFGKDLSGKTTLGKLFQRDLDKNGQIALMLSASEISNRRSEKFEELLAKKFSHQYGPEVLKMDMFKNSLKDNPEIITLIIDDYESMGIKRSDWQTDFFKYLTSSFSSIILLANSSVEIEVMAKAETKAMLDDFESYRILQLGHVKRDELIERWIAAGDDETQTDDQALNLKLELSNKINIAVGSNFIPTYPFYVLTMMHLIEDGDKARTQSNSYADLYNYFITHALVGSGVKPEDLDFYLTYLSFLAHALLIAEKDMIKEDELDALYQAYSSKMALNKPFHAVHRLLVNAKILKNDSSTYSFSLSYYRYFFIAKFLSDNLDEPENKITVDRITNELYKNEYANIVIFLIHHSKNKSIINAIVMQARSQFENALPQDLSANETKKINGLLKEEIKFGLLDITPEESRKKELSRQDSYERTKSSDEDESIMDIFGKVNLAFKTIDVLGQIANNYYGSLDADSKADIVNELYSLGLRGLRVFLSNFENYIGALRIHLEESMEEKGLESSTEKSNEVDKIIYGFMQLISFAFLKRISDSVSSKNLIPTIDHVVSIQNGPTASLVDVAVKLNFPGELSKQKIKVGNLHKDLETNYLPRDILKMFVLQHMYKFNIPFADKQSICAQLGIAYTGSRKIKSATKSLEKQ